MFSRSKSSSPESPADKTPVREGFSYDLAMRRIFYLAVLGCVIVGVYAWGVSPSPLVAAMVGIMSAGAALLSGGLVGFLFGVPHLRTQEGDATVKNGVPDARDSRYTPSTSLEQISDWLTKIIVGVSLIDLRSIAAETDSLATRIQTAMGAATAGNAFALGLILYFLICGFTFGFLWSRLYLADWFRKADEVKKLRVQISQLERRRRDDAKALSLMLPPPADDEQLPAPEAEIVETVKNSSRAIRDELFRRAHDESAAFNKPDRHPNFHAIVPVLKGLIAADPEGRHFEYRAELSFALSRRKPPDLPEAEKYISEAIRLRDQNQQRGWRYYEMRRARYRILMDPVKSQADAATKEAIMADLRASFEQRDKWASNLEGEPWVRDWLNANNLMGEFSNSTPGATSSPTQSGVG